MRALEDIEAVLFDLGGTLVDYPTPSWPIMAAQCVQGAYGFLVKPESERPPRAAVVPGPAEARARRPPAPRGTALLHRATLALRRMVRALSGRTLPWLAEACARPLVAPGHLFDDSLNVLRALRQRGYRLGLVSNTPWGTPEYLWMSQLDRFGLTGFFEVRLFSSVVGFRKPDPRIFRKAMEAMHLRPDRVLFIGDTPEADILGAQRCGMRSALLVRPGRRPPRGSPTPDLLIESLTELLDALPGPAKNVDSSGRPT